MELFHVLNRGVDKRTIFLDDQDYARFVHNLFEFNDTKLAGNAYKSFQRMDIASPSFTNRPPRNRIVDIHGWCLMKNHFHILLSERRKGGLAEFIRRVNIGYVKYFNERYDRTGTLFQGRSKKVQIKTDAQLLHILHYIHLNPLDYQKDSKQWRERRIRGASNAIKYLEEYKWSSLWDYQGKTNFPSILTDSFFRGICNDFKKDTVEYLQDIDIGSFEKITLE